MEEPGAEGVERLPPPPASYMYAKPAAGGNTGAAAFYLLIAAPSAVVALLALVALAAELYPEPSYVTRGEFVGLLAAVAFAVWVFGVHAAIAWGLWQRLRWVTICAVIVAVAEAAAIATIRLWLDGHTFEEQLQLGYGLTLLSAWFWPRMPLWIALPVFFVAGAFALSALRRGR